MRVPSMEEVAREICEANCLRQQLGIGVCVDPRTGANSPCEATKDQLIISWYWEAAQRIIALVSKGEKPPVEKGIENAEQG